MEKVNVQIFYLDILCYKFAIPWLMCWRRVLQSKHGKKGSGVGVLWRRMDGCEAKMVRGGGGCLEVEKENVQMFYLNILCYKYDISWLLCM